MRYLLIISIGLLFSCKAPVDRTCWGQHYADSTQLSNMAQELTMCNLRVDLLRIRLDSVQGLLDTTKTQLFLSNYKVEKVRFYLNICDKNPTQVKFLRGWIKRGIE